MYKPLHVVAVTFRWLAGLWILGWALYVTLWDDTRLSSVKGTLASLAMLLIPAALAFGISCVLDRSSKVERGSRQEQLPR
jgi:hypothetical protein